jgi:integrase
MIWQPIRKGVRVETWSFRFTHRGHSITRGGYLSKAQAKAALKLAIEASHDDDLRTLEAMRKRRHQTVGQLLEAYQAASCPGKTGRIRLADALDAELRNIKTLRAWWEAKPAGSISEQDRLDYWGHRQQTVRAGTGDRTTELELGTLNNALAWSWRRGDLKELPRSMRASFRDSSQITHAREHMPANGDELHKLARALFAENETVAWAYLLAAFTGLRRRELMALGASPKRESVAYPPGYMDDNFLRVTRAKRGRNPRVSLTDPQRPHIKPLLNLVRQWHAARHPDEPLLLPEAKDTLSKTVTRVAAAIDLPRRTLHGARAYYASVRLAQGVSPDAVAQELGQRSGDDLVKDVYGADPDDFDASQWTSLADRLTWLPTTADVQPAWTWWTDRGTPSNIVSL